MQEKEPDNIKLAVLEEKLVNMVEVISRLDATIEKLSDLSVNVSKMLAVHEEKIEFARETAAETAKEINELEIKLQAQLDETNIRIGKVERKVWVTFGGISLTLVTLMIVSPIVTQALFFEEKPAIIVPRN